MERIIQNAAFVPRLNKYIASTNRHDYQSIEWNGKDISVDGGYDYLRKSGDLYGRWWVDYSLTEKDSFETIREMLLWGTRGKTGNDPLQFRPIRELSVDHLQAILDNCPTRSIWHDKVVRFWLKERTEPTRAKNIKKVAYYAHSMAIYNTALEKLDVARLAKLGYDVINPNSAKYRGYSMEQFVELARSADVVYFRAFTDGKIGSGVSLELAGARKKGIEIFEFLYPAQLKFRALTREQTRERMGLNSF